ncbi:MAG: hypothetical protein PHH69_07310 [Candidatus Omnitrophica bacterium]|nr:hypothetical protein [Candidatus Omnitrophota bacterium]MDD5611316.1 hypothetical protein [Candidatus Omnitrophota bacterium]
MKEIYYNHRSGFTHGGKKIPEAVDLADRLNRKYVKNNIDGKEVRTPSLKWFECIVQSCLMNFLIKVQKENNNQVDYFKEISLELGKVNLKLKRDVKKGQIVIVDDVDLD